MKPVVTAFKAWSCIVISLFAIAILSVLALLFNAQHHSMMSSTSDPADGHAVAKTCLGAISVYGVRFAIVIACHFIYMRVMGGREKLKRDKQRLEDGRTYKGERGIALQGGEVREG